VLTLRDSPDEQIREAGIVTRTGRKWSATETVSQAESSLMHKDNVGVTAVGRQGIGATKTLLWSQANQTERRALIQSEVRKEEENKRQARAVEMGAQGAWTKWETMDRKLTWEDIWKYEPLSLSFLLRSVHDLLPSPANLCRWGLITDPTCSLCKKKGTLEQRLWFSTKTCSCYPTKIYVDSVILVLELNLTSLINFKCFSKKLNNYMSSLRTTTCDVVFVPSGC